MWLICISRGSGMPGLKASDNSLEVAMALSCWRCRKLQVRRSCHLARVAQVMGSGCGQRQNFLCVWSEGSRDLWDHVSTDRCRVVLRDGRPKFSNALPVPSTILRLSRPPPHSHLSSNLALLTDCPLSCSVLSPTRGVERLEGVIELTVKKLKSYVYGTQHLHSRQKAGIPKLHQATVALD